MALPIASNGRWSFLHGGTVRLALEGDVLSATAPREASIHVSTIHSIHARKAWLGYSIEVSVANGDVRTFGGMDEGDARRLVADVQRAARGAARNAARILIDAANRADLVIDMDGPRRLSEHTALVSTISSAISSASGNLTEVALDRDAAGALVKLRGLRTPERLRAAFEAEDERRLQSRIPAVQAAAAAIIGRAPSAEQALAAASEDDSTLVLAGAGSGKTALLIARIAHLVVNEGVDPAHILALAFNRDAVTELRERLPPRLHDVTVHTFHSFGLAVIGQAHGERPRIATIAHDRLKYAEVMADLVERLSAQPALASHILQLVAEPAREWRDAFDFATPGAYFAWIKENDLRTLSGDLVKSFEEIAVANFLTLNQVPFEYEAPYAPMAVGTASYVPYRPDFKLLPDLYIEHFALDRAGRAPVGWSGYESGVQWKRAIHLEHGTRLIETHSWEHRDGVLEDRLRERLETHGVRLETLPATDAVRELAERQVSLLAVLLGTMVLHRKASQVGPTELTERVRAHSDRGRANAMRAVLDAAYDGYQQYLADDGSVDFQDLIIQSTTAITSGGWHPPFKEILVDEAQDLSRDRMQMLAALRGRGARCFLVGDDRQSVYRFAGSDIALIRDPSPYLGPTTRRALTQTWRHGNDIAKPANSFVMADPRQLQQSVVGLPETGLGITVVAAHTPHEGIQTALSDIRRDLIGEGDVLVLGRYRNSFKAVPRFAHGLRLRTSTVHAAKGQEADYVIVLGLDHKLRGFPSRLQSDPLMDIVIPSPRHASKTPWAEERRLLYVSITRARRGAWLIADARYPSDFVTELQSKHGVERVLGTFAANDAPPCLGCKTGRLLPGMRGASFYCTHYPLCRYSPPRCSRCGRGAIVQVGQALRCATCDARFERCPQCTLGILVLRRARGGAFRGCSQYATTQPCEYTTTAR